MSGVRAGRATTQVGRPVVRVEPMHRRHLRAVTRIERANTTKGWSSSLFAAELRRGDRDRRYLVALVDGTVVGFAGALFVLPDAHVTTISVDPAWQGRGIATRLLAVLVRDALCRGATALTLEVRATNEAALALYRRFGLAPAGVRKNYYADLGEDALVMWAHDLDSADYADRLDAVEAALPGATVVAELSRPAEGSTS